MSQFIQLHLLTAYPPSNLNRDDLGRPKTATVGGTERLRVSSQSLKRAWRTSDLFEAAMAGYVGTRTKGLGEEVRKLLLVNGVAEKKAVEWATKIVGQFATAAIDKKDKLSTGQLVHYAPEEWAAAMALADTLGSENRAPEAEELAALRQKNKAVDMALFGRMLANNPENNVDAAVQVAHAFSVNPVKIEDDYFTAVDDLNNRDDASGAGHVGEAGFGSGVFYLYLCINRSQLQQNLQDDSELATKAIRSLVEAAAKVAPTGKQNSFASRAYTSFMLAEVGEQQPRSLSVAFLKALREGQQSGDALPEGDLMEKATAALCNQRDNFDKVYGACSDENYSFNVSSGEGTLEELLNFVAS